MNELEMFNLIDKGGIVAVLIAVIIYMHREKSTTIKELNSSITALQESNKKVVEGTTQEVHKLREELIKINKDLLLEIHKSNAMMASENEFLKQLLLNKKDINAV